MKDGAELAFGRAAFADFDVATRREWLLANGLGGYACGTLGDANTRSYHGLLVAALTPPLGRTLTVAKLDAWARRDGSDGDGGRDVPLSSNEFADGTIDPHGHVHVERFLLDRGLPVWHFAFGGVLIEKRVLMVRHENTTLVRYRVLRALGEVRLALRPLCTWRDHHGGPRGEGDLESERRHDGFVVRAPDAGRRCAIRAMGRVEAVAGAEWYRGFHHRVESARGLEADEDLYTPGTLVATLADGEALTVAISTEAEPSTDFEGTLTAELARRASLFDRVDAAPMPPWVRQLVRAADAFLVTRGAGAGRESRGRTVIAGYPWFGDWGRDTMIALPGLTLATGRFDVAREVLLTFAPFVDRGMLPNRFPDGDGSPEYNTVDAALWYVHAVHAFTAARGDDGLAAALLDTLVDILEWHRRGTRYGIGVDAGDGLLASGVEGVQLTWMDAKVGDRVITPRTGKCVEINALWYNALACTADLAARLGKRDLECELKRQAVVVERGFRRFWNAEHGCLHDVVDGPEGFVAGDGARVDGSCRPNQIFAVSLPRSPLQPSQMASVVATCERRLLTSHGLRSLAADDPRYVARYGGGPAERDAAYHQGTVWAWLLGPFAEAHHRVHGDAGRAIGFLEPLGLHLRDACVGSVGEIFDAGAPHAARGCFAQAWSVAETLRVWMKLAAPTAPPGASG